MEDIDIWQEKFEFCNYSKKLIGRIEYLNTIVDSPIDIIEVKKGIYYTRKYHATQMRQSGEPYYSHPIEVAIMLADFTALEAPKLYKSYMINVALLHDTIEDTILTHADISKIFDKNIADNVERLTRIKPYGKISSGEMLNLLIQEQRYDIALIKVFDRLHNLQTINAKSTEKALETVKETIESFLLIAAYLEIRTVEQQLLNVCNNFIKQHFPSEQKAIFRSVYEISFFNFKIIQNKLKRMQYYFRKKKA
ncbi:HD domain-containing protein [Rickettsia typhi]|uniref:Guanosine-3,5-bis(Diphosphate) 3-pyrophosphohydrolase SpoTb n=3 Tax=Rickettsia typhi TaxID=785 RepID=Q68WB3_RICTY|nr:HD domain-containing protein [Rickettsia typhi]AAU04079.1 guanosine-3,5-bis(diphosphate) 3-pyrophosphohydrolase SpoTb [Rickettsia typhi str. Wilmington]AFE54457.1 guanosine-3',5'-bis(diphosphate) 3'-pyrophosphohydrolase [Rickettsia typhi str. TH1527]AFE55296.1 guanosine-3',5'-bis(diphosphate) 3'-pyrophosphohydrolase [Rickettsia typhi str. B9991CWPP]CAC33754.1 Guanosine-3,5-bis(diphosphate) 3-pyrophosphohydrolase [Rickettsia typhi str. Wilmington]